MNNVKTFTEDENGNMFSDDSKTETKCSACEKKSSACISFFAHENAMMHKDMDNERAHRTTLFVCATFIVITLIFVLAYTIRMNSFIDAIKTMNAAIVELASAKGIAAP